MMYKNSKIMQDPVLNHDHALTVIFLRQHLKKDLSDTERRAEELMALRREEQVSTADAFTEMFLPSAF